MPSIPYGSAWVWLPALLLISAPCEVYPVRQWAMTQAGDSLPCTEAWIRLQAPGFGLVQCQLLKVLGM